MKSLLSIIGLVTVFQLEARPIKEAPFPDGSEDIHFILYRVKAEPKVDVLQIPSEEKIILENISKPKIRIDYENFNGVPIYTPIDLNYSMTKKEVCRALHRSFGISDIHWFQGVMSRAKYLEMFPPDCLKKNN